MRERQMAVATAGEAGVGIPELRPKPKRLVRLGQLIRRKPLGFFGFLVIVVFVICAVGAPLVAPYPPNQQVAAEVLRGPSLANPFGTDNFGRDQLSRIIFGAQVSLQVGLVAVLIGTVFGTMFGVISGYFEGRLDLFLQRVMDAWIAFPGIIFALAILAALGPGVVNVMIAIGLANIPTTNRIVRSTVLKEKNNVYIEAAHAIGCTTRRIMVRHILPNITAPIIVIATIALGEAILSEAALSFLGVGVQPPTPSWGQMLSRDARNYMLAAPWMAIFPGLAISFAVLGWNLLGDALRDVWDPRMRGSGTAGM